MYRSKPHMKYGHSSLPAPRAALTVVQKLRHDPRVIEHDSRNPSAKVVVKVVESLDGLSWFDEHLTSPSVAEAEEHLRTLMTSSSEDLNQDPHESPFMHLSSLAVLLDIWHRAHEHETIIASTLSSVCSSVINLLDTRYHLLHTSIRVELLEMLFDVFHLYGAALLQQTVDLIWYLDKARREDKSGRYLISEPEYFRSHHYAIAELCFTAFYASEEQDISLPRWADQVLRMGEENLAEGIDSGREFMTLERQTMRRSINEALRSCNDYARRSRAKPKPSNAKKTNTSQTASTKLQPISGNVPATKTVSATPTSHSKHPPIVPTYLSHLAILHTSTPSKSTTKLLRRHHNSSKLSCIFCHLYRTSAPCSSKLTHLGCLECLHHQIPCTIAEKLPNGLFRLKPLPQLGSGSRGGLIAINGAPAGSIPAKKLSELAAAPDFKTQYDLRVTGRLEIPLIPKLPGTQKVMMSLERRLDTRNEQSFLKAVFLRREACLCCLMVPDGRSVVEHKNRKMIGPVGVCGLQKVVREARGMGGLGGHEENGGVGDTGKKRTQGINTLVACRACQVYWKESERFPACQVVVIHDGLFKRMRIPFPWESEPSNPSSLSPTPTPTILYSTDPTRVLSYRTLLQTLQLPYRPIPPKDPDPRRRRGPGRKFLQFQPQLQLDGVTTEDVVEREGGENGDWSDDESEQVGESDSDGEDYGLDWRTSRGFTVAPRAEERDVDVNERRYKAVKKLKRKEKEMK